jgi:hypothetical protein
MLNDLDASFVSLVFVVVILASWGIGWRIGRKLHPEPGEDPGSKFIDASMALLGLLLAFTFSMSLARHDQRRLAVIAESNAIGDFYTCASLLKEPARSTLQAQIREYAQRQLDTLPETCSDAEDRELLGRSVAAHARMTELVAQGIDRTPTDLALINTLNNLTSTHASRRAAYDDIVPWSIIVLLLLSSLIPWAKAWGDAQVELLGYIRLFHHGGAGGLRYTRSQSAASRPDRGQP